MSRTQYEKHNFIVTTSDDPKALNLILGVVL